MMSEFTPKKDAGNQLSGAVGLTAAKQPEVTLPEVGDTMRIAVQPWGFMQVVDDNFVPSKDTKIIEVEVKAIKGVKVIFE